MKSAPDCAELRISPQSAPLRLSHLLLFLGALLSLILPVNSRADDFSWNAGDGSWFDAHNWTPNGVPGGGFVDVIRIGDLPGIQNSTVILGPSTTSYHSLSISSGMTLDMAGGQLVSGFGPPLSISGANSRLLVRPSIGPNFHDLNGSLELGFGAQLDLIDNARVRLFTSSSDGIISGRGLLQLASPIPFNNNGVFRPGINGGLEIFQGGILENPPNGLIDLDGSAETGSIQFQQQFSQLEIAASGLTDSFSSTITMAPGSLLTMNITDGWSVDANGSINVAGFGNANNVAQIAGNSLLDFGGTMTVGGNLGRLRLLTDVNYGSTANVTINLTDGLRMTGATTVQGAQFSMGEGALLAFDGPTSIQGGTFTTHSTNFADGFVAFNGPTNWSGNTTIHGVARQNGTATVNAALGGVINADILDMDGSANNTIWNLNNGLVVNAERISTSLNNRFDGTMNIGGGFSGKLTMNVGAGVPSRWTMAGTMNLTGNNFAAFPLERLAGSAVRVSGDVNVNHQVRVSADAEFVSGSSLNFHSPNSLIQFSGDTLIHSGAVFSGEGTLENGHNASLMIGNGVMMGQAGLTNRGLLQIGESPGVISVDRFENLDTGTWLVELGGLSAGAEHDLMIVGSGLTSLNGFLEVDLIDLGLGNGVFLPEVGDTFTILASLGGVNGMFLNSPISTLGPQEFHWDVIYNPHDVQLQLTAISVPEPSSLLLMGSLCLGLLVRRKKLSPPRQPAVRAPALNDSYLGDERFKVSGAEPTYRQSVGSAIKVLTHVLANRLRYMLAPIMVFVCVATVSAGKHSCADDTSWIAGNGVWSNSGNWSTGSVPTLGDNVLLGNLPGIGGSTVFLNQDAAISGLHLSSQMTFNTNGFQLQGASGNTSVTGNSTLIVSDGGFGADFSTSNLGLVGTHSAMHLAGGQVNVHGLASVAIGATISGDGTLWFLTGNELGLFNNGNISSSATTGHLRFLAGPNTVVFDLDGVTNLGTINVGGTGSTKVSFGASALSDSFSGTINLGSDAELAMNISSGWEADFQSSINVTHTPGLLPFSLISGGPLTASGQINLADNARLVVASDAVVTNTMNAQIGNAGGLAFTGDTSLMGGNFSTFDSQLINGFVEFVGATNWSGTVNIHGAARQLGDATTNGATINAGLLEMSVLGGTNWEIGGLTTINAGQIDAAGTNRFNGSMTIGGGALSRLSLNLDDPSAQWTMAGQLNLSGNALSPFPLTRLQGSAVRIEGDLHVNHQVRIGAPVTFAGGSTTHFETANARLQSSQFGLVESGAQFNGAGTLENGVSGTLILLDGVMMDEVGLVNQGLLGIGDTTGVATVDRFEMTSTGQWQVDIGGSLAGVEFDRLLVSGAQGALLNGQLSVDLVDLGSGLFLPNIGDEFSILFSLGNINGEFLNDPISLVGSQSYQWETLYGPHEVKLRLASISTIPEPSSALLLGVTLGLAFGRRRV